MLPFRRKKNSIVKRALVAFFGVAFFWIMITFVRNYRAAIAPVSSESIFLHTLSKASLIKKVEALQNEVNSLEALRSSNEVLERENSQLKTELGRNSFYKGVLARVVTFPNKSLYDTLIIDAGTMQGITVGQGVYAFGGVGLGTVSSVAENQATVLLFSSPGRETAATVSQDTITVTLIGRGGGEYEIRMPRDINFTEGDVITEQSTQSAPLATIQKIVGDPRDPFQRILAKAPLNLQNVSWVIVR